MKIAPIITLLAEHGPHTAQQIADRFGCPVAEARTTLAEEVFRRARIDGRSQAVGRITCDPAGYYQIGDPARILSVQS